MLKDLCFEVIHTCPNNCKFCSSNSSIGATKTISLDTFKRTINHFMENGGIEEISISGGEPFLHPDIMEMVKFCKSLNIRTVIFTSGIKRARNLNEHEIDFYINEYNRKVQELEEQEPWNTKINEIVKRNLKRQLPDVLEELDIVGISNISILNFVPQGRGLLNRKELMLSNEEMREFADIFNSCKDNFKGTIRVGIPLIGNIQHLCTAGTEKLDIKYDGTVLPCPAFKEMNAEKLEKYGIRLYNIYDDLENLEIGRAHV